MFGGPQDHSQIQWFSLKDSQNLEAVILLTIIVYYNEQIKIKVSQGKGTQERTQESPDTASICSLPIESCGQCLMLPAMICNNKVLPTKEIHLSLVSRVFTEGQSHRHGWLLTWLTTHMANLSFIPTEVNMILYGPRLLPSINHTVKIKYLTWPKASGKQSHF